MDATFFKLLNTPLVGHIIYTRRRSSWY